MYNASDVIAYRSFLFRDAKGQVPYLVSKDRSVRNEFRQFCAEFPARYDYTASNVPAALPEEQEQEKRAREAERRKVMKKAKNARTKVHFIKC